MLSETTGNSEESNDASHKGKKIYWQDEQDNLVKKLKKTLTKKHFSLERVNKILDKMHPDVAKKLLTEKYKDIHALWMIRFFLQTNFQAEQGIFDKGLFEKILAKLMKMDYLNTYHGFISAAPVFRNIASNNYFIPLDNIFKTLFDEIGKEVLMQTLSDGNLEQFMYLLIIMKEKAVKEALCKSDDNVEAIMMHDFLWQADSQAKQHNYDSNIFKCVISIFLRLDFPTTQKVFYKIKEKLENDNDSFFPQLEKDFQEEKEDYSPRQSHNTISDIEPNDSLDQEAEKASSEETDNDQQNSLEDAAINKNERSIMPEVVCLKKEMASSDQSYVNNANSISNDIFHTTLDQLMYWLQNLPEWLQQSLRNTTPVKALIKSVEQISQIYDHTLKIELFSKSDFSQQKDNNTDSDMYGKAKISYQDSINAIDMSMIYKEHSINGYIFPVNIESGNVIAGEIVHNDLGCNSIYL